MKPTVSRRLRFCAVAITFVTVAPVLAQSTIQSASTQTAPAQTATLATPDSQTMATYTQTTWRSYEKALKGGATARDLPPTDCPPQPVQVCQDSWKIKTINPFE